MRVRFQGPAFRPSVELRQRERRIVKPSRLRPLTATVFGWLESARHCTAVALSDFPAFAQPMINSLALQKKIAGSYVITPTCRTCLNRMALNPKP